VKPNRIVKKFTQSGHGFTAGTTIRYDSGTNTYQRAFCDNSIAAETIGVVEKVNGNDFWVNMGGYISGLSLGATGIVYFLAQQGASGGLISDPSVLTSTDVRKAILYSTSTTEGIVLGHPGVKLADPTDLLYANNLIPVGTLQPYGGFPTTGMSAQGWMVCDGRRLYAKDFTDLHGAIGQNFYADGTIISPNGNQVVIAFSGGDTLGLAGGTGGTGETVVVAIEGTGSFLGQKFAPIAAGATTVTVDGLTTGAFGTTSGARVRVYGQDIGMDTVFFIPDMRRRVPVGASVGLGIGGSALPSRPLGEVSGIGGGTGQTADFLTTVNYMIRTKNRFDAVVLTGHNHDVRYIRFDATHGVDQGSPSDLTLANRNQFRSNARVLGDGTDGTDTFYSSLEVSDSTANSSYPNIVPFGMSAHYETAGIRIQGSSLTSSSISIYNNLQVTSAQKDGRINFFGVVQGGASPTAAYMGSVGFALRGTGNIDEYGVSLGATEYESRVGFNIMGLSGATFVDETALLITRRTGSGVANGSIRYKAPKNIKTANVVGNSTESNEIDSSGTMLVKSDGEILRKDFDSPQFVSPSTLYSTGSLVGSNVFGSLSWNRIDISNTAIPSTARGVIIQWFINLEESADPNGTVIVSSRTGTESTNADDMLVIGGARSQGGGDQGGCAGQSFVPLDTRGTLGGTYSTNRRLWWRLSGIGNTNFYSPSDVALQNGGFYIQMIGYF
jgi:hypothetical protein